MARSTRSDHYRRSGVVARKVRPPNTGLLALNTSAGFSRAGEATYWSGAGVIATAAANEIRFEDRGDGNGGAWLLEGAATNNLDYSSEFDQWGDFVPGVTVTADSDSAPDGTTTADNLSESDAATAPGKSRNPTSTAHPATVSLFVKKDTDQTRFPEIQLRGGSTEAPGINTETGATGSRAGTPSQNVIDAGDWWHWLITRTQAANITQLHAYPAIGTALGVFNPAATGSVILWGMQCETGLFATSYIPTSAATASRLADNRTFAAGEYPERLVNGIWEFDFYPYFPHDGVFSDVVLLSFGGTNDELRYNATSDAYEVVTSGASRAVSAGGTHSLHQKTTIKLDFETRTLTISGRTTGNGDTAITSADEWPSNVTLRVGGRQGGSLEAAGRYSDFRQAS